MTMRVPGESSAPVSRGERIVVITGDLASGKTTLLQQLGRRFDKHFRTVGVACITEPRRYRSTAIANRYWFETLPDGVRMPWARRNLVLRQPSKIGSGRPAPPSPASRLAESATASPSSPLLGLDDERSPCTRSQKADGALEAFTFDERSLDKAVEHLESRRDAEICLLDDIGPLELSGGGFDGVLTEMISRRETVVIMAVKKRCLSHVLERYGIEDSCSVFDLDADPDSVAEEIVDLVRDRDSHSIAIYAVASGLTETGLGSFLHSIRFPLAGHVLLLLQIAMLTAFGRNLKGRGLLQISFIAAMLKSFSPLGPRLKPMLHISTQGALFALPSSIAGWSLLSALSGAALTSTVSLAVALGIVWITYGPAYLSMLENGVNRLADSLGLGPFSFVYLLCWFLAVKIVLALAAVIAGHFGGALLLGGRLARIAQHVQKREEISPLPTARSSGWKKSALGALHDLGQLRLLIPLTLTVALIGLLSDLSIRQFWLVPLRALVMTWIGLMIMRRVNPMGVVRYFERRHPGYFSSALSYSLVAWNAMRHKEQTRDR